MKTLSQVDWDQIEPGEVFAAYSDRFIVCLKLNPEFVVVCDDEYHQIPSGHCGRIKNSKFFRLSRVSQANWFDVETYEDEFRQEVFSLLKTVTGGLVSLLGRIYAVQD